MGKNNNPQKSELKWEDFEKEYKTPFKFRDEEYGEGSEESIKVMLKAVPKEEEKEKIEDNHQGKRN